MRIYIFLMLISFPLSIMGQISSGMNDNYLLNRLSQKSLSINYNNPSQGGLSLSTKSKMFSFNNNNLKYNRFDLPENDTNSFQQDSLKIFSDYSLTELKSAGTNLQWSCYLQYASNIMGYLSPFVRVTKETKKSYQDCYTNEYFSTRTKEYILWPSYVLAVGSSISSLISIYEVGRAGSHLSYIGNQLHLDNGYKLKEAGDNLQSYSTLSYISSGLGLISSIMLTNSISSIDKIDDIKKQSGNIYTAGGLALTGLIFKIFAVNRVGEAGELVKSFSDDLKDDKQKSYLVKFGTNMQLFDTQWHRGLYLTVGGLGLIFIGGVTGSQQVSSACAIAGIGAIIIGHIYTAWIAPTKLGSAGSNLRNL